MRRILLFTAALAALSVAAPAEATVTVVNYGLSGDGTGSLALNFDNNTSAYSLNTLDLTIGSAHFTESNSDFNQSVSLVAIGGSPGGYGVLIGGTDDFAFAFNPTASTQTVTLSTITPNGIPPAGLLTITQSGPRTALPEPATWAMMLVGFGGIGMAMRRNRRRHDAMLTLAI